MLSTNLIKKLLAQVYHLADLTCLRRNHRVRENLKKLLEKITKIDISKGPWISQRIKQRFGKQD